MRSLRVASLIVLALIVGLRTFARADESGDAQLRPMPGLQLWLSAAREAAARKLDAADGGAALGQWTDLAGVMGDAAQAGEGRRPMLVPILGRAELAGWVVRFDGLDDNLRILDVNRRFTDFTLFVVAAPHSNAGGFRGLLAVNQKERRDYETGFNLDLNGPASTALQNVNVEGRGFGGARNLLGTPEPFSTLHLFEAVADSARKQMRLAVDGQPNGRREYAGAELIADEVTIGARHFENGPGPQHVQGFLHGDIAEVILFNRVLTGDESQLVRQYLLDRHADLRQALPLAVRREAAEKNIEPLVAVLDPPPVQMLLPGFVVRELPVDLSNTNNLRYRADGKLYALGYNGNVSLLSDRDGDGLEDSATLFFENKGRLRGPIGMAVIPLGHALLADAAGKPLPEAQGVVVASKGKVSALLDRDGDDVAEQERVIATGWQEIPQNVDAVGVAIHPVDGSIYFGLGTAAYNNAYLLDRAGRSAFDLGSERGTIQRIAPDLSSRSTVCTGVRFTIGMGFDAHNELFVSEQEGATWLPNGNPFDELLHIRPGLHYGFPPRHPRHLPQVFDEPSLFDYAPQHQSTCGMTFNLPLQEGGPIFGPASWRGDAIVTGESRGKLYRTRLVRDQDGRYVAANQLIGCLKMLTVDCCLTPDGDLLVACHSGGPDWGTGPEGRGKLYAISYDQSAQLPQPSAIWAAGPREVRVAFDQPLDPAHLKDLAARTKVTYGQYVAAGDRFETIRPGYAVTQMQQREPRFRLPVYSAGVTADRQTLILATAEHPAAVQYALQLPGLGREAVEPAPGELAQHAEVDLAYSLHGVQADWQPRDEGAAAWNGWLPHVDLDVARPLIAEDQRQRLAELLRQPGMLTLSTQLDTRGLFTPAVQPGSQRDYDLKDDQWVAERAVELESTSAFSISIDDAPAASAEQRDDGLYRASVAFEAHAPPRRVTLTLAMGSGLTMSADWRVTLADGSQRSGPLALHRFILPWAGVELNEAAAPERSFPELAGASWGRGRRVFLSKEAACFKCHVAHGSGGQIGPDLSNLVHRDYASVLRDISQPSYAINPDFITYHGRLQDGRTVTGAVRSDGDRLLFGDKEGQVTAVDHSELEQLQPSAVSIMPDNIPKTLGPERMRDLLAFLLTAPPTMPHDSPLKPPPPRTRSEVAAALQGAPEQFALGAAPPADLKPLHVLLVAGQKDHGPGEHDYPAWLQSWSELLGSARGVTVSTAMEWPAAEQIQAADAIAFFQRGSWTAERAEAIDAHLARGGGLIYIHWAVEGGENAPEFAKRIGLASHAAKIRYRHGPLELGFATGRGHPIARNFDHVHFHDESYWLMLGDRSKICVLGTGVEQGEPRPLFWTFQPSGGRVFVSIPGHYSWTFDDPLFRILLLRGLAWTARQPVDRFNDLVTLGVPLADG